MNKTIVLFGAPSETDIPPMPNGWESVHAGDAVEAGIVVLIQWNQLDAAMPLLDDAAASHQAAGADITLPDPAFVEAGLFAIADSSWDTSQYPDPAQMKAARVNRYVPSLELVRSQPALRDVILNRQRGLVPALTESCDLACRMCPFYGSDIPANEIGYYRDYMERRQGCGHVDSADFLRWVDDFREVLDLGAVSVYGPGEPFLHPETIEVLKACNDRGLSMNFATNGNRFTQVQLDALKDANIGVVIFSLDALTAETYAEVKPAADFALIIGAIEQLIEAKRAGSKLSISVSFIRQEYNAHEEEAFVEHWKQRVDSVVVTSKYHAGQPESDPLFTPHAVLPCPHLENSVHILSNGDCWACSAGVPDEFALGNVDEISPESVLGNLDDYVNTRIDTGEAGPLCRNCVWWRQAQRIETWVGGKISRVDQPYSYRVVGTGA